MTVKMSTLSAILKDIYEGPVREQLNNKTVALRRVEKSSAGVSSRVGGKDVVFPVHFGRNAGIGARGEYDDLPAAGFQATEAARVPLKYQYGSVALTGQTLELAEDNTQAFISALDLEMNGLKKDLAKDLNRQVYGDGSGTLAVISTTGTATVNAGTWITVDSGFSDAGINAIVDVYLAGDTTADSTMTTITAVDRINQKIKLDKAVTFAAGKQTARLIRYSSKDKQWTGFSKIVDDSGVLYDIDPADVDQWRAHVDANGGTPRALTELMLIQNIDAVADLGTTSLMLTSKGVRRSYFALLTAQRRFVNTSQDNKKFEGGFVGLAFTTDEGEVPLVSDIDAPKGILWGIDESHITVRRDGDWSFMDRDGNKWVRIPGTTAGTWKDAYSATMYQYSELSTDVRGAHFKIEDITES